VEVTHRLGTDGKFEWVALFNHSGHQGKALHRPLPIRDIALNLKPQKEVKAVRLLQANTTLNVAQDKDRLSLTVPTLDHYEIVLFEYAE